MAGFSFCLFSMLCTRAIRYYYIRNNGIFLKMSIYYVPGASAGITAEDSTPPKALNLRVAPATLQTSSRRPGELNAKAAYSLVIKQVSVRPRSRLGTAWNRQKGVVGRPVHRWARLRVVTEGTRLPPPHIGARDEPKGTAGISSLGLKAELGPAVLPCWAGKEEDGGR